MVQKRKRKPWQRTRCLGDPDPNGLYTKEGVMRRFGLGALSLMDATNSGIVKPLIACNRAYYRASELIAWIESVAVIKERPIKARRKEHGEVSGS